MRVVLGLHIPFAGSTLLYVAPHHRSIAPVESTARSPLLPCKLNLNDMGRRKDAGT